MGRTQAVNIRNSDKCLKHALACWRGDGFRVTQVLEHIKVGIVLAAHEVIKIEKADGCQLL